MLMAAASQKYKMFLTVQDLTCPGASLIHSLGIAAHVPGVAGLEANARQYMPAANAPGVHATLESLMLKTEQCGLLS